MMYPMHFVKSRVAPALLVSALAAALAGCNRPNAAQQDAPVAEVGKTAPAAAASSNPTPQPALPVAQSPARAAAQKPAVEPSAPAARQNTVVQSPVRAAPPTAAKPQEPVPQNAVPEPAPAPTTSKFVAYYFHRTMRCPTCLKIESSAKEAVEKGFKADMDGGRLKWSAVNIEEPGNEHFEQDFELESSSLVLVEMSSDKVARWKNLEQVWDLVHQPTAFQSYVRGELRAFMSGGKVAP